MALASSESCRRPPSRIWSCCTSRPERRREARSTPGGATRGGSLRRISSMSMARSMKCSRHRRGPRTSAFEPPQYSGSAIDRHRDRQRPTAPPSADDPSVLELVAEAHQHLCGVHDRVLSRRRDGTVRDRELQKKWGTSPLIRTCRSMRWRGWCAWSVTSSAIPATLPPLRAAVHVRRAGVFNLPRLSARTPISGKTSGISVRRFRGIGWACERTGPPFCRGFSGVSVPLSCLTCVSNLFTLCEH